jgi:hypothetical protein
VPDDDSSDPTDSFSDDLADDPDGDLPHDDVRPRWEAPAPTGVQTVDAAVAELGRLDGLPTGEHVALYDAAHRKLQDALADLDGA